MTVRTFHVKLVSCHKDDIHASIIYILGYFNTFLFVKLSLDLKKSDVVVVVLVKLKQYCRAFAFLRKIKQNYEGD